MVICYNDVVSNNSYSHRLIESVIHTSELGVVYVGVQTLFFNKNSYISSQSMSVIVIKWKQKREKGDY